MSCLREWLAQHPSTEQCACTKCTEKKTIVFLGSRGRSLTVTIPYDATLIMVLMEDTETIRKCVARTTSITTSDEPLPLKNYIK